MLDSNFQFFQILFQIFHLFRVSLKLQFNLIKCSIFCSMFEIIISVFSRQLFDVESTPSATDQVVINWQIKEITNWLF